MSSGEKYKPSEHGGLKKDGEPDKRSQQEEFAYGTVDAKEAGSAGGHAASGYAEEGTGQFGGGNVDPREAGSRGGHATSGDAEEGTGQFAGGNADPVVEGRKGGLSSGRSSDE